MTPSGLFSGWLSRSGTIAAALIGAIVLGCVGWRGVLLLAVFLTTSSLLTRWHASKKHHPEHSSGRSASQVMANGLVAALLAVWVAIAPSPELITAFAGSIAAAAADTWASEVGMLSPAAPRLITTWRQVAPGTSGGITLLGTIAGAVGASVIARVSEFFFATSHDIVWSAAMIAMFTDSLLGATVEGRTRFFENNAINFLATLVGAALAFLLAR